VLSSGARTDAREMRKRPLEFMTPEAAAERREVSEMLRWWIVWCWAGTESVSTEVQLLLVETRFGSSLILGHERGQRQ